MAQSLVKNYVHIVFGTKYRQSFITDSVKDELFSYLGGTSKEFGSDPIIVGGHVDHVHVLVNLSRKIALMKLVEVIKTRSSKWIKTMGDEFLDFYWQGGYGAFSVNPGGLKRVIRYIERQEIHHRKEEFLIEYPRLLDKHGIEYDERYLWD